MYERFFRFLSQNNVFFSKSFKIWVNFDVFRKNFLVFDRKIKKSLIHFFLLVSRNILIPKSFSKPIYSRFGTWTFSCYFSLDIQALTITAAFKISGPAKQRGCLGMPDTAFRTGPSWRRESGSRVRFVRFKKNVGLWIAKPPEQQNSPRWIARIECLTPSLYLFAAMIAAVHLVVRSPRISISTSERYRR